MRNDDPGGDARAKRHRRGGVDAKSETAADDADEDDEHPKLYFVNGVYRTADEVTRDAARAVKDAEAAAAAAEEAAEEAEACEREAWEAERLANQLLEEAERQKRAADEARIAAMAGMRAGAESAAQRPLFA